MTPAYDPITQRWVDSETGLPIAPGTDLGNGQRVPGNLAQPPAAGATPAQAAPAPATNAYGTAGEPSVNGAATNPAPVTINGLAPPPAPPAGVSEPDVVVQARSAAQVAAHNVDAAKAALDAANGTFDRVSQAPNAVTNAEGIKAAGASANEALRGYESALGTQVNALSRIQDAQISADARAARAKDPNLNAYYDAQGRDADARAALADAQLKSLQAHTQPEIDKAAADTKLATQQAISVGLLAQPQADKLNADTANVKAATAKINALLPTDVAQAQAGVGKTVAETGLVGAQTTATAAQATVSQAQAALTSAQAALAQATLPADVAAAQLKVDTAQQQLDQAKQLLPGIVAQQGATLAGTEAQTAGTQATTASTQGALLKAQQATQYGLEQKIAQIKALRASGQITDDEANQMWAQAKSQGVGGPTPYEAQQQATVQRGQDNQLAGQQTSTLGSLGSSIFSSMLSANRDAPAGSNAMAQSYGGVMGVLYNALKGLAPQQTPAMLNALQGGPLAAAANAPMQQSPSVQNASNVSANAANVVHAAVSAALGNPTGSAGAPTPTVAPNALNATQYGADPLAPGQLPGMLAGQQLGTPDHVDQLWAGSGFGAYGSAANQNAMAGIGATA